jgi:hypothetical protein
MQNGFISNDCNLRKTNVFRITKKLDRIFKETILTEIPMLSRYTVSEKFSILNQC